MKGVFFTSNDDEHINEELAKVGLKPDAIVTTFANSVALFEDDSRLVISKLFASKLEGASTIHNEDAALIRKLAEPKSLDMTPEEHETMYAGYLKLNDMRIIEDKRSRAAHRAWTTSRLWAAEVLRGNFTHEVTITYTVAGKDYEHTDQAVSAAHARSLGKKNLRKVAKDLNYDLKKLDGKIKVAVL